MPFVITCTDIEADAITVTPVWAVNMPDPGDRDIGWGDPIISEALERACAGPVGGPSAAFTERDDAEHYAGLMASLGGTAIVIPALLLSDADPDHPDNLWSGDGGTVRMIRAAR